MESQNCYASLVKFVFFLCVSILLLLLLLFAALHLPEDRIHRIYTFQYDRQQTMVYC